MECIMICRWGGTEYSPPFVGWVDADDERLTYYMSNWMRTGRTVEVLEVQRVPDIHSSNARKWRAEACQRWTKQLLNVENHGPFVGSTFESNQQ